MYFTIPCTVAFCQLGIEKGRMLTTKWAHGATSAASGEGMGGGIPSHHGGLGQARSPTRKALKIST